MNKTKTLSRVAGTLVCLILLSGAAFAAPVMNSADDQTFDQNQQAEQLRDITITDDATTAYIKAGSLKITIPDELDMLFNTEMTQEFIVIYGDAVDSGKVLESPEVTFEDKDKTIIIPILADFEPEEYMVVTKVFVEGFHNSPNESYSLYLHVNDETATFEDNHYIYIQTSTQEDTHEPEQPTNIGVQDVETGVKITWTDPTDLDLQTIHILRGKNTSPSGSAYVEVAAGAEEYIDTDVETGDTINYILRSSDGKNYGANTDEVSFVVGSTLEEEAVEAPEDDLSETPPEDTESDTLDGPTEDADDSVADDTADADDSDDADTPDTAPETFKRQADAYTEGTLTDIQAHWAEAEIKIMTGAEIVKGKEEGKFHPNDNLNRAEAAALIYRTLGFKEGYSDALVESPFEDVPDSKWYMEPVALLKTLEIVKGQSETQYNPEATVNRAEFLNMAMNAYHYKTDTETPSDQNVMGIFADVDLMAWYVTTVAEAYDLSFVSGKECASGLCFNAEENITRAEATKMLYDILWDLVWEE